MKEITLNSLEVFFQERPSLSKRGIEREAGLPDSKIKEYLRGKQDLSKEQKTRLLHILINYGWIPRAKGLASLLDNGYPTTVVPKEQK